MPCSERASRKSALIPNRFALGILIGFAGVLAGCGRREAAGRLEVIVYSALDREFAEPLLQAYSKRTGVQVWTKFDIESSKAVGLTESIIAEASRPRCDLFWNNEILNTLR